MFPADRYQVTKIISQFTPQSILFESHNSLWLGLNLIRLLYADVRKYAFD